jgi:hypothetical protein
VSSLNPESLTNHGTYLVPSSECEFHSHRLTLPMFIHALDNDLYFYQITLDFHHKSCSPFFVPVFNKLRWDVIVRFVDIGGNVDHECLSLLVDK